MPNKICIKICILFMFPMFYLDVLYSNCVQDSQIGRVTYVRNYFGGDYQKMPGLCRINSDCGAYNAWNYWDLGFGSGSIPQKNSIMILDNDSKLPYGHMAVIIEISGNFLTAHESNWHSNERCDCNVRYTFDPNTLNVIRNNDTNNKYSVLGFIYGEYQSIYNTKRKPKSSNETQHIKIYQRNDKHELDSTKISEKSNVDQTINVISSKNYKEIKFSEKSKYSKHPGTNCGDDKVYDCKLNCISVSDIENWVGDKCCDDGQFDIFLNCSAFNSDGGDCKLFKAKSPREKCSAEAIYDCSLNCVNVTDALNWIGDGICDNGEFGININCSVFDNDNGDCFIDK